MPQLWLVLAGLASLCGCDAFKILVVFPMASRSHGILGDGLVRLLAERGHEITYITAFPVKRSHQNVTQIDVSGLEFQLPGDNYFGAITKHHC
ncbi:unnamed protein product [Diatraea saccharalis]|uniref:Uncharacterized protein n=1 Tax=Diatraea saccharalis TaxID=40085 RepID=A0A9N9RA32_9NEOP|nr:unnamed protein product [Diatraea saccharalis]